jgi:hypothetical protein
LARKSVRRPDWLRPKLGGAHLISDRRSSRLLQEVSDVKAEPEPAAVDVGPEVNGALNVDGHNAIHKGPDLLL